MSGSSIIMRKKQNQKKVIFTNNFNGSSALNGFSLTPTKQVLCERGLGIVGVLPKFTTTNICQKTN